ncbi:MAG: class A beta-lactamase-related serine hydrolase [Chloroflexi bacterium]|nr:class A beta-lactamase-related serine hydrolase [Chloroflexota bacterium]MDA1239913.1 class A beta-lactamase-related serine hydrolase [Chloroflexota bacterium]
MPRLGGLREGGTMDALVARMNALSDEAPFHVGWYLKDLLSGQSASRHGDVVVPSASTRKVAILMTTLQGVCDGRYDLEERITVDDLFKTTSGAFQWFRPGFTVTFHDILLMMMIVSDNTATRLVTERVGLDRVQAFCDALGMRGTVHRLGTPNYSLPRDHGPGHSNDTCPDDQGVLLDAIVAGASDPAAASRLGVTPELCLYALDLMSKQRLRNRIPSWMPEGVRIANKTGSLGGNLNDVAVVYQGETPRFIFTYFTDGVPVETPDGRAGHAVADHLAGNLARMAWDALTKG